MSEENVEIVRASAAAFNRGDLDAWLEYWTDDIDYRAVEGAPDDHGPIHGKDALRDYARDWRDTFDDFRQEPVEQIDAGDAKVVTVFRISGRAKLSGVETDLTYAAFTRSETGRSSGAASTGRETRPSKPPGSPNSCFGREAALCHGKREPLCPLPHALASPRRSSTTVTSRHRPSRRPCRRCRPTSRNPHRATRRRLASLSAKSLPTTL
jgi:ketosteroid isomerase-like protein